MAELLPSTAKPDIAQFKSIAIPLVRRIYPQLIANKIVSVQPLLSPSGLIPYLRHLYANKGSINNTGWQIKPKKKKIWRDVTEPWVVSDSQNSG